MDSYKFDRYPDTERDRTTFPCCAGLDDLTPTDTNGVWHTHAVPAGRREASVANASCVPRNLWQSAVMRAAKRGKRTHWVLRVDHPTRRDGAIAIMFLCVIASIAGVLQIHHGLDKGTAIALAALGAAVGPGWLVWATFRVAARPVALDAGGDLGPVADQLAIAVRDQWKAEAENWRLNDPYPLPVSWSAADESLADSWDVLVTLGSSGAGWPMPTPEERARWAEGPAGLTGSGNQLKDVLDRVPTRRLVVLGEPGSGKTMLLVRLVLDMLTSRAPGSPVPVLTSIASWNPEYKDLWDWFTAQLVIDYPGLGAAPSVGAEENLARSLIANGLIWPLLDGLDEIPADVRASAITRLNEVLQPGVGLVVTSRHEQYREVVRPPDGPDVALRAAAVIELWPLSPATVASYLQADAGGPAYATRWDPVLAFLGTTTPVGQALTTPLMVSLARTIYNPPSGAAGRALPSPAELCDDAMTSRLKVEARLFDAYIPAAYRRLPADRWTVAQAEAWHMFLADHLERRVGGPDLAWWQLWLAVPQLAMPVVWLISSAMKTTAFPVDVDVATDPYAALARNRRAAVAVGVTSGGVTCLVAGLIWGYLTSSVGAALVAALLIGVPVGVRRSGRRAAWSYELARFWLATHRHLPWPLMYFLEDAHKRGILRQSGAVYQFRHIELQRRLAARVADQGMRLTDRERTASASVS